MSLGLLLSLSVAAAPALAGPARRSAGPQQQEAQALARLSTPDLHNYFEGRRQLERRSSDQRLAALRQLEDCLERTRLRAGADSCLERAQQQRLQQRQQWMAELQALRQRYKLPVQQPQGHPQGQWAQPRPQPQTWQPRYQPQAWQPRPMPTRMPTPTPMPVEPYSWY